MTGPNWYIICMNVSRIALLRRASGSGVLTAGPTTESSCDFDVARLAFGPASSIHARIHAVPISPWAHSDAKSLSCPAPLLLLDTASTYLPEPGPAPRDRFPRSSPASAGGGGRAGGSLSSTRRHDGVGNIWAFLFRYHQLKADSPFPKAKSEGQVSSLVVSAVGVQKFSAPTPRGEIAEPDFFQRAKKEKFTHSRPGPVKKKISLVLAGGKKKYFLGSATAVNRTRSSTLEGWNPNHWTTEAFLFWRVRRYLALSARKRLVDLHVTFFW